ncbi:tripartite tricarboxylate transporter permease [Psychrobacter sp. PP-21]|uniref:tripartite tricarboxylate transporter permease n=1 Tax=Psychrobacter sp. PP-21 TaxID=2957503 RepID=UPI0030142912
MNAYKILSEYTLWSTYLDMVEVGVYSINSTTFDMVFMVGLGIFGYFLRKLHFPLSALILGYVLGELMESNLRRALSISQGEMSILWSSPITVSLWGLVVVMIFMPIIRKMYRKRFKKTAA